MIYVCEACGKWGGLGLALARPFENLARALKGEQVGLVDPEKVFCPDCNIEMRQVTENDRLHVLSDVMQVKKEIEKPLDEKQKKYIKLFLGDGHGKCTDGYLMTKLGLSSWDEAKKLIEQYENEGKNE